jgi:short subunit dehydrogenase-like uncharacterized protein
MSASPTILLYGATGFSGRLIADEFAKILQAEPGRFSLVLGGRDGPGVQAMAVKRGLPWRAFGLGNDQQVRQGLQGINVVLNAAGPFAFTARRMLRNAIDVGCHYVDISGEPDVYLQLDDYAAYAYLKNVAVVSGAGFWAGASDVLLASALADIEARLSAKPDLGAVRIAMSSILAYSGGSALSLWRSMRQQTIVIRGHTVTDAKGDVSRAMTIWHEPVGRIERTFEFGVGAASARRIGSVVSLVDTLTARLTVRRENYFAAQIESYVEMNAVERAAYQASAAFAPLTSFPLVRNLIEPLEVIQPPTPQEVDQLRHLIVLEIDDVLRTRIVDWRWDTPNVYRFTAQLAPEVALGVVELGLRGWRTPAEALGGARTIGELNASQGPLRSCALTVRKP